jgi:hypothetical protein
MRHFHAASGFGEVLYLSETRFKTEYFLMPSAAPALTVVEAGAAKAPQHMTHTAPGAV